MDYLRRMRELRIDRDKSQREIAELLCVGQKTYSDYELGKTRIPLDGMIKLALYYGVSMDYICGLSDDVSARLPDE